MAGLSFNERFPRIITFDTETTGFDPVKDSIIEFGFILREYTGKKYEVVKHGNWLVQIDYEVPVSANKVNGLTKAMLDKDGIEREVFGEKLTELLAPNILLIAYNTQFDALFVQEEIRKYLKDPTFVLLNPMMDVLTIYRDRKTGSHKLVNAISKLGVEGINSHRAYADADAAYNVFKALMLENFNPQAYINRFGYYKRLRGSKFPQIMLTLPFIIRWFVFNPS